MFKEQIFKTLKKIKTASLEDIAMLINIDVDEAKEELLELEKEGVIGSYSDNMYEYVDKKRIKTPKVKKPAYPTRRNFYYDQIYFYARDYYLLYAVPTIRDAVEMAKERFVQETPFIKIEDLGDGGNLYHRLYKEFDDKTIELYRKSSDEIRTKFREKNKHKFRIVRPYEKHIQNTIDSIPEYFNFGMNDFLEDFRIAITLTPEKFIQSEKISLSKKYSIRLRKDYKGSIEIKDSTFDTFIALMHLYKSKEKDKDKFVIINVDDVLFLRGYERKQLKGRKQSNYPRSHRVFTAKQIEFLSSLQLFNGKVTDRYRKYLIDYKHYKPERNSEYYFKIRMNFNFDLSFTGQLNSKVLQLYHGRSDLLSRRLGYYISYLINKENNKDKFIWINFPYILKLFEKSNRYLIDPKKRQSIKNALKTLGEIGLISNWRVTVNRKFAPCQKWYMNLDKLELIFKAGKKI